MSFFSFSSPTLIGLDIKPDGVRLVQLSKKKHRYVALKVAQCALPQGVVSQGQIRQKAVLIGALTALVQTLGLQGCPAAIPLPVHLVKRERLQLPAGFSAEEIKAEIASHLQGGSPSKVGLCMDFSVSGTSHGAMVDVLFVAARDEDVSPYLQCVNAAGLHTKIVDIDIYALKRAAYFALQQRHRLDNDVNALVSVVNDQALLIVFNAEDVLFYHQWPVPDKADFLTQLKRHMQAGLATLTHGQVHQLLLATTHGYLNTLLDELTPAWAYQVVCPNPFKQIELSMEVDSALIETQAADFLLACGAAMRSVPVW